MDFGNRAFTLPALCQMPASIGAVERAPLNKRFFSIQKNKPVVERVFPVRKNPRQFHQKSGAAALSVITEVSYFHGGLEILANVRWNAGAPLLRKDFIIDPYQILEARHAGADAVLLIAVLLDAVTLKNLRSEAERIGMDALVEVHNESELQLALDAGATLIGVNNRDLRTFEVSLDVSLRLGRMIPKNLVSVSESGIRAPKDIRTLSDAGFKGFLVGEHLMRSSSPGAALAQLLER